MADSAIGPGSVLAGRYRLDDLLSEHDGARFWRATDNVLARNVAVHVLDSADPRAEAVLAAARTSATVTDGHFLRVLDASEEDGVVYLVNEWGSGVSLDQLVADGPLPPRRAAWVVKEVAEAITTAHAQGVAHGRLLPESVLVTEAGSVKLIGFVVDAALHRSGEETSPDQADEADRESDVVNLAALLYAGLVGKWPGSPGSEVPEAPREHGRPLRPRQVRAGIPRPLDAICQRVLLQEAHEHVLPIETAQEIAAALSDYVGDPTGVLPAVGGPAPEQTQALPREALPDPAPPRHAAEEPTRLTPTGADATTAATPTAAEQTQAGVPVFYDDDTGVGWVGPGVARALRSDGEEERPPPPPPPPLPEPDPKPLFAPDAAPRSGTPHDKPLAPPRALATGVVTGAVGRNTDSHYWPWRGEDDDVTHETGEQAPVGDPAAGRSWLRLAGIVAGCAALLIAIILAFNLGRGATDDPDEAASPTADESESAPEGPAEPWRIAGVSDLDPEGDPPEENSERAPLAADGDVSTTWVTSTYFDPLSLQKSGVGLVVDLGRPREVSRVDLRLVGSPHELTILAAEEGADAPTDIAGLVEIGSSADAGRRTRIGVDPTTTQYVVVWLTELPQVPEGFRGEVAEIIVRP